MNNQILTRFDATYYKRYVNRNKKKIEAIVRNVGKSDTLLDIGCNQGYVIRTFLERGLIRQGSGVELSTSVVDPWLLASKGFSLFEGNVIDYSFDQIFETVIFNSVFHHIFGTYGKDVALDLWDNIIDHCDKVLIFETGVLTEFGQYYWKDEYLKYYSYDQEIINALLYRIGSRLKSCKPIVSLPIHLTKRFVYKIELHPVQSENNLKPKEASMYGDYYRPDSIWIPERRYQRTSSSSKQELIEIADKAKTDRQLYSETEYFKLRSGDGKKDGFGKKILKDPYKRLREFFLLASLDHPKILKLLEVHPDYGFIFDARTWQNLGEVDFRKIGSKKKILDEIISFFSWASNQYVTLGVLDLDPDNRGVSRRLIDIVDFHPNNFLVNIVNGEVNDWAAIDFEYAFNNGASRNYKHLHIILRQLQPGNPWNLIMYYWYYFRSYLDSDVKLSELFLRYFYVFLYKVYFFIKSLLKP